MRKKAVAELEARRLALQQDLDSKRDAAVRNRMGQFATPTGLAVDIQRYAKAHLGKNERVRFMDPAIGTGSFYSALLDVFAQTHIRAAVGYEIDRHYGRPAATLWGETGLDIRLEDFTKAEAPEAAEKFNLVICNPPYVRHHHIVNGEKQRLKMRAQDACGVEINGLAGLYCYFLGLGHAWMADGGLAGWLIPSEFMDVNYGVSVKRYLLDKVTLLHIHRFDPNDVQFGDALVSSAVVWFRNEPPRIGHEVRFTYGGTLERPKLERLVPVETLRRDPKWTCYPMKESHEAAAGPVLGDFFKIKRGLATGNNNYFILSAQEIERRRATDGSIQADPTEPALFAGQRDQERSGRATPCWNGVYSCSTLRGRKTEIKERYPQLWAYLEEGREEGIADGYLCRHRALWYTQEYRPPAPFVCTYLGRSDTRNGRPFRFILNHSLATAANVYLMLYPKEPFDRILSKQPTLKREVWELLNGICPKSMLSEGRVYGGGLHKLEPRELSNVPAASIAGVLLKHSQPSGNEQKRSEGIISGAHSLRASPLAG